MPRPITLPEPWRSLTGKIEQEWESHHPGQRSPGAVQLTADTLLCDTRTLRRWANGVTQPDRRARDVIAHVFRKAQLQAPY